MLDALLPTTCPVCGARGPAPCARCAPLLRRAAPAPVPAGVDACASLLATTWRDGPALALAGFLVANLAHTVNHAVDLDLGGHGWDPWGLATLTLVTAVALVVRLRQLGWVVGEVGIASTSNRSASAATLSRARR